MSDAKYIAKGAAWLMIATTAQKLIAFIAGFIVARVSGPEVMGRFAYPMALIYLFVSLADLGATSVVIREWAASEERGQRVLRSALRWKVICIPLAVVATLAYAAWRGASMETWYAVAVGCAVVSADAVSLLAYGVLRAERRIHLEAVGMLVTQTITAIVSVVAAYVWRGNVVWLVAAILAGSVWNIVWSMTHVLRGRAQNVWKVAPLSWKEFARMVAPFAIAGVCIKVSSYADSLFLEAYQPEVQLGFYSIAYKLTYAFQFLPLTFVASLYPGLSAVHAKGDKKELQRVVQGSVRLMAMLGVPIAVGLSAFSPLLPLLYGEAYRGAVIVFQILPWVLIPIFLDFPIGSLLNATHRAGQKTTVLVITTLLNVIANALLVPVYGAVGAAWAGVVSFTFLMVGGLWYARHDYERPWFWKTVVQVVVASGLLYAAYVGIMTYLLGPALAHNGAQSIVAVAAAHWTNIIMAIIGVMAATLIVLLGTRMALVSDVELVWNSLRRRIK